MSREPERMAPVADEIAARFRSDPAHAVVVVSGIAAVAGLFPRLAPLSCLIVLLPEAPAAQPAGQTAPCANPWCKGLRHLKQVASFRAIAVLAICPLTPVCDDCGGKPPFQSRKCCSSHLTLV
ncbi:MAG: hypothetical protein MUF04_10365, partial [Akkermansiaceae bacterium]|nr:hypothetical protein [Akkermansiaceae bacterium]